MKIRSTVAVLMSIKCLCCFYYTAAAAFVYVSGVFACVYVPASVSELSLYSFKSCARKNGCSDLQRQSGMKTCFAIMQLEKGVWQAHRTADLMEFIHADARRS